MKKVPQVLSTLTALTLMASVPLSMDVYAQFDKYKSKTKFNPPTASEPAPSINIPDTGSVMPSFPQDTTNFVGSDDGDDEDGGMIGDDSGDGGGEGSSRGSRASGGGSDSFGRKNSANAAPKDKKYVNLNPETAFGPEVVTSFDFPNVSLLDLTKHMQKLTGINLILDKDIKGKISISTPSAITIGDAWKAYLQALSINGYSLVKSGAYYTIVNNRDIRYATTSIYTGNYTPDTENYIMKIIPLKYVSAREVNNNFRPFSSRYGRMTEIKETNTIIVQDTATQIKRLEKLIKLIDVPGHEETLQIIKVKNSSAQEIATLLDKILKGGGSADNKVRTTTTATGGSGKINISKIIAEPRTNSIIALANADGARELRELILKLDVKSVAAGSGLVHVYYLNHGDAEALSKTLNNLISNQSRNQSGINRFTTGGTTTNATLFNNDVKLTADKDNNAIVVTAAPTDYETLKVVIAKLDVPRDQVYVEGLMMETQVNKGNALGISIFGAYGTGGTEKFGFGNTSDLMSLLTNNITNLSGLFVGAKAGRSIEIKGPTGTAVKVNSVNGLINAIATNSSTNVLATPQILTLDNVEGVFESGEQVPVPKTTNATSGQTQTSIEQQKVALTLKITPQINKVSRFIKLKIDQKIEDFSGRELPAGTTGGVGTVLRNINTTVVVRDRDTIAMGGLMRDKETNQIKKVPLLGDIPVLGWLFKNTSKSVDKVNLLFFMTPKILSPYEKANSENVKDLLNRRQAHLKSVMKDDDAFNSTVKGIYEKAKRQEAGPLYDKADASKLIDPVKNTNDEAGVDLSSEFTANELDTSPNYQELAKKIQTKNLPSDSVESAASAVKKE